MLQLLRPRFCAAFGTTAAVMSEEAVAEREHARQGHSALVGVNGAGDTVLEVDAASAKVRHLHRATVKRGYSQTTIPATVVYVSQRTSDCNTSLVVSALAHDLCPRKLTAATL